MKKKVILTYPGDTLFNARQISGLRATDLKRFFSEASKYISYYEFDINDKALAARFSFLQGKTNSWTSAQMHLLLSLILSTQDNAKSFFAALPKCVAEVTRLLVDKGSVDKAGIVAKGIKASDVCSVSFYSIALTPLFSLYELTEKSSYYYFYSSKVDSDFTLRIPDELVPSMVRVFLGKTADPLRCIVGSEDSSLPEGAEVVRSEADFLVSYPLLQGYDTISPLRTTTLKTTQGISSMVMGRITIKDTVPPRVQDVKKFNIGMYFLPYLFKGFESRVKYSAPEASKVAYKVLTGAKTAFLLQSLLQSLKGVTRTAVDSNYYPRAITSMLDFLGRNPGQWIDLEILRDLFRKGVFTSISTRDMSWFPGSYDVDISSYFTGDEVDGSNKEKYWNMEIIRAVCAILYGIGAADLGLRPVGDSDEIYSPLQNISFVRITPLGEYDMGLVKSYEFVQQSPSAESFDIDPGRLIVRSKDDGNIYLPLLQSVATPIGSKRYLLSYESFLSGCSTLKDVEQKVEFFRQYICRDLPPLWEDFFQGIRDHCSPLRPEHGENFKVFSISPDDVPFQRLLQTDPELRSMVVMAEGYRILVRAADYDKLLARLRHFGYLQKK